MNRPWNLKKIAAAIVALAAVTAVGFYAYMELVKAGILKYNKYDRRTQGNLKVGSPVPDLTLALYDGSTVQLSSLWKKPVMLVFGSCT